MATNLLIFLRINWPKCVKSTAKFGGLATIWGPVPPTPQLQRGTTTGDERCGHCPPSNAMRPNYHSRIEQESGGEKCITWQWRGQLICSAVVHPARTTYNACMRAVHGDDRNMLGCTASALDDRQFIVYVDKSLWWMCIQPFYVCTQNEFVSFVSVSVHVVTNLSIDSDWRIGEWFLVILLGENHKINYFIKQYSYQ